MTSPSDYPLIGPPSIPLGTFQAILQSAHSPAAGEASGIYAASLRYNVDPAVILAIAQHESSFGKAGIAVGRDNLFGSRYYPGMEAFGAVNRGGWAAFPTYAAGAAYTASLLASGSYAGAGYTARTFPNRYAPTSDGNDPRASGSSIVNAVNGWRGLPASTYTPPSPHGRPATPAAAPAATPAAPVATPAAPAAPSVSALPVGVAIGTIALAALLALILIRG